MLPTDVPLPPRGMAVASSGTRALLPDRELTKRYVYRGWGYDLFDPDNAYLVRRPEPFIDPAAVDLVAQWIAEARKPKPKRRKPKPKPPVRQVYPPLRLVPPLPPEWRRPRWITQPDPEPEPEPPPPRKPRPAPGWTPLTVADVSDILEGLADE